MPPRAPALRIILLGGMLIALTAAPAAGQGRIAAFGPASIDRVATALSVPAARFAAPAPRLFESDVSAETDAVACAPRTVLTACDGWTGQDKLKHAVFAFSLTASTYYLVKNTTNLSRTQSLLISFGTMTAVGLTKEWLDWENDEKRCFSAGDMAANSVGMLLAAGFVTAF